MATATASSPPPPTPSPPHPLKLKPLTTPDFSSDYDSVPADGNGALRQLPPTTMADSAKLMGAPSSPVRVNMQSESWAQPHSASIEGFPSDVDRVLPRSPEAPAPLPPTSLPEEPKLVVAKQRPGSAGRNFHKPMAPTFAVELPLRPGEERPVNPAINLASAASNSASGALAADPENRSIGEPSPNLDPNRQSRDTDASASTQQQASTGSSAETSSSSVSGINEPYEGQTVSEGRSAGSSIIEGGMHSSSSVPQLQYHHQPALPRVSSVPIDSQFRNYPPNDLVEQGMTISRHLTPNSFYRRSSMPRPSSAYSLHSDHARSRSPYGPGPHARTTSSQARRSPEIRPVSTYAELLNTPYPQPAPAPLTFDNSQLRSNVGNNASLLSMDKTLEMYRQNVKKTNDLSIQYSFAVFLISTAQEQGLDPSETQPKKNKTSAKGESPLAEARQSSPAELVREAKHILTRLASGGYPFAQYYLADGYASGLFSKGKEDYNAAFPLFVMAAKHGHAESAYRAALCYEFGWGCRSDPAKAIQFLRTAASRSHPGAMTRLGKACLSGDLGDIRYKEGITWLKRATESADTTYNGAPYQLGQLYEEGYGDEIFKDENYAAELYTQAAELGHAEGNYRMGDAYEHGKLGCPRDPALSVHFYTGAAERGHAGAMMGLCAWYMVGAEPILEKDEEEAYEWARRSAELGLVKAQYAVGYFTEMGIGCRRDVLEANVWYVKAADAGDERAKQRLAAIRVAVSGGGTPMDVAPPRDGKMRKTPAKDDKECVVM